MIDGRIYEDIDGRIQGWTVLSHLISYFAEVGADAFFYAFALASAKQKKSAKARRKKSAKKNESAERERKKARIRAFSATHSGKSVSEPKAAWQGEMQGS